MPLCEIIVHTVGALACAAAIIFPLTLIALTIKEERQRHVRR